MRVIHYRIGKLPLCSKVYRNCLASKDKINVNCFNCRKILKQMDKDKLHNTIRKEVQK